MKANTQSHRGRPKGTGLDDRAKLRAVADMLAANPQLKPTTAIKHLGVTDPSAIRRLRDKLKEMQSALDGPKASEVAPRTRSIALKAKAEPTFREERSKHTPVGPPRPQPVQIVTAAPEPQSSPDANSGDWLTSLCALGLKGASAAMEMQRAYFDYLLKNPAVTLALEQQVRANEFVLACTGTTRHPRRR
jgi:hypothetical protein